jgi:uncharacterized protein YjiS (DUF1127 family)
MAHTASFTSQTATDISLPLIVQHAMALLRERRVQIRARAQLRGELNQYSDRDLADMGLCRGDIEDVVHNRYAR